MTLAGSLVAYLESNWSLTGDLAAANLEFHEGWYNKDQLAKPQVTVNDMANPKGQFYGTYLVDFYPRYTVNVWYTIPRGAAGTLEYGYAESLRHEVVRIVNSNRSGLPHLFNIIVPIDEGTPLHEVDSTPRVLRYEITIFAVRTVT